MVHSSKDLSHHLVPEIRDLQRSEMKVIGKMLPEDLGAVSLSGGLPHQTLFPMTKATFSIPALRSLDGDLSKWVEGKAETEDIELLKTGKVKRETIDISQIFQYGVTNGYPEFIQNLEELTFALHRKPYSDAKIYLSIGSLDILHKCMRMFVLPHEDTILVDQFCYGSGCHLMRSWGAKLYPVSSDSQGLVVDDFERILDGWNEAEQGRKPHLLYLVPVGNNPSGVVMPPKRYDAIYALCQKHDLLILEDDPYYHLQFSEYIASSSEREASLRQKRSQLPSPPERAVEDDLAGVLEAFNTGNSAQSFLSRDVDGRVLRMDSVSKCFGPGFRTGWVTCNDVFFDKFLRLAQISTQVTNNWSQAILASYMSNEHWGVAGFVRWLFGVRLEYQQKRDFFLDCFHKYCPADLVSTVPCGGAMYQWLTVNVKRHPRYTQRVAQANVHTSGKGFSGRTNTRELMDELYQLLMYKGKVLVMPGFLFVVTKQGEDGSELTNHLRVCFAGDFESIETGVKAIGTTITGWFKQYHNGKEGGSPLSS